MSRNPSSPTIWTRFTTAVRSMRGMWSGPITSSSPEVARLWGAPSVAADVRVDLETSLNVSTFFACGRLLATNIALHHYTRLPRGGKQRNDTSRLSQFLREPNPEQSRYKFVEQLVLHAAFGNAY